MNSPLHNLAVACNCFCLSLQTKLPINHKQMGQKDFFFPLSYDLWVETGEDVDSTVSDLTLHGQYEFPFIHFSFLQVDINQEQPRPCQASMTPILDFLSSWDCPAGLNGRKQLQAVIVSKNMAVWHKAQLYPSQES